MFLEEETLTKTARMANSLPTCGRCPMPAWWSRLSTKACGTSRRAACEWSQNSKLPANSRAIEAAHGAIMNLSCPAMHWEVLMAGGTPQKRPL
ncbi:hypothetical protein LOK74_12825 [Brevibacillus humidisoli]|uniref:hypothetical protein n=1 Tax=Brevibacillus humidisoli TaxID=2895522 RepID=UPI001E5B88E5|nr:hypothetical protein [Brevibacillus humidisoli]UFJ38967.1 hypothetical protein LOK74_12825 [Brevibacillus humidisoli]